VKRLKVTVLMAVHNGEYYLHEAMESILRQSFCDFEFIIVDDASTDRTRELIFSFNDARVRLIENREKLGQTRSLNRGLEVASGEFVARQDADDISEPERLAKQVAFLETHHELALLGTWYKKVDAAGAALGLREVPCKWLEIRWALMFFCPFVHSSVMLRKTAVLEKVGIYNETFAYAQDYELWSRIAAQLPVANLPEYLVRFRMSAGSMTSTYGEVAENEIRRAAVANLAAIVDSEAARRLAGSETELDNIRTLLFGDYRRLSASDAVATSRRVLPLLHAFTQLHKDEPRDCRSLEKEIRSRIATRLIEIARRPDQNFIALKELLLEARRLQWAALLTARSLGVSLKLARSRFSQTNAVRI
jgi:hypothetical protein